MKLTFTYFLFFPFFLSAQFTNQSALCIMPNTEVLVDANCLNENDIYNKGTITLLRDYENTGTYNDTTNAIISLEGDSIQNINTKNLVNRLIVNGIGKKVLQGNIVTKSEIKLLVGNIVTNQYHVQIKYGGQLEGGSSNSFVDGKLIIDGVTNKFFPIGKDEIYTPVSISDIRYKDSISLQLQMLDSLIKLKPGLGIDSMSQIRHYKMEVKAGTLLDAFLTLPVVGDEGFSDISKVVVAEARDNYLFRNLGNGIFFGDENSGYIKSQNPIKAYIFGLGIAIDENKPGTFFIPSALSPLATNSEDQVIKVYSRDIISDGFYFRVYDKTGHTIFESFSFNEMSTLGWDGKNIFTGIMENSDVYHYQVGGEFFNSIKFKSTGIITLIR